MKVGRIYRWGASSAAEYIYEVYTVVKHIISIPGEVARGFQRPVSCLPQVLYASLILYGLTRPCVLVVVGLFAVVTVEMVCSVVKSPLGSLIDAGVRHNSGSDG